MGFHFFAGMTILCHAVSKQIKPNIALGLSSICCSVTAGYHLALLITSWYSLNIVTQTFYELFSLFALLFFDQLTMSLREPCSALEMKKNVENIKLLKERDSLWLIIIAFIVLYVILSQSFIQGGFTLGERIVDFLLIICNILLSPFKIFGAIVFKQSPHGSFTHILLMAFNVLSCLYFDIFNFVLLVLVSMGKKAIFFATEYWYLGFSLLSCCQTVVAIVVAFCNNKRHGVDEQLIQNI